VIIIVLDESTRVCLQPIRGVDGSDYINASFIDVSSKHFMLASDYSDELFHFDQKWLF
jgi:protein tyrosine phosphatase